MKKCYLLDDFDLFSLVLLSIATSGSNSIGSKKIQTSIVQVTRSFLQQLCECWKQKFSKKKLLFHWKKNTYTIFLVIPSFADVRDNFITLHKVFKQNWCKWKGKFSKIWSVVENEVFWKKNRQKGTHSNEKKDSFFGSCITEYDKPQKISYTGPRGLLTFIVQLIRYKTVSIRVK